MNCIFCDTVIADAVFFCDACERERLLNTNSIDPNCSREGQALARTLKNRYELIGQVFRDSLSIDFKAVYIAKGRTDCIHVLPMTIAKNDLTTQNFHDRVKSWSRLKLRNLLRPVGSGRVGKLHFCINLFPEGIRLSDMLLEAVEIPLIWGLRILHSLCLLLQTCHNQGLVHANLKPTALFINAKGILSLTNIGLVDPYPVELLQELSPGDIALYSSPEQLMKDAATVQSDIYSFALIAYRLLTGIHPFETAKEMNILYKNLHESVVPPAALNPAIPNELNDIILHNLHKKPQHRADSMNDFLNVLNKYLQMENEIGTMADMVTLTDKDSPNNRFEFSLIEKGKIEYYDKNFDKALQYWQEYLDKDQNNFAVKKFVFFAEQHLASQHKMKKHSPNQSS
ncbi:protein kinase [bacterium]|nr:protein kinase [bacterium]